MKMEKKEVHSITQMLKLRAEKMPDSTAYVHIKEEGEAEYYTFKEVYETSAKFASFLAEKGVGVGDRCTLIFRQNIELVYGVFACNMIGAVAVPLDFPEVDGETEKWAKIIANCKASCIITNSSEQKRFAEMSKAYFNETPVYCVEMADGCEARNEIIIGQVAILQYTSGSTSEPKGVVVTNCSLLDNLTHLEERLVLDMDKRWVSWIPYHHDMGLIAGFLTVVYSGNQCIFMAPSLFKKNPIKWIEVISEFGGTHTVAPNFAYEILCSVLEKIIEEGNPKKISLSSLLRLISGSEPVRFNTLIRFMKAARELGLKDGNIITGYGLAEATLVLTVNDISRCSNWIKVDKNALSMNQVKIVESGKLCGELERSDTDEEKYTYLVGNGIPVPNNEVMILNADGEKQPPLTIGEVCATGGSIAAGYYENPQATFETFVQSSENRVILHTGDAGFFDNEGELYITGRYKDIIIIHGVNYYPADIEEVSSNSHVSLNYASCVFSASNANEDSLVVVQEVLDCAADSVNYQELEEAIRKNILSTFALSVGEIVFVKENSIPRTQSGKIQHSATKKLYLSDSLKNVLLAVKSGTNLKLGDFAINDELSLKKAIVAVLSEQLGITEQQIDVDMPFMQMGLNSKMSIKAVEQMNTIDGVEIAIADIFNYNTVNKFVKYIYSKFMAEKEKDSELDSLTESQLAELLADELGLKKYR